MWLKSMVKTLGSVSAKKGLIIKNSYITTKRRCVDQTGYTQYYTNKDVATPKSKRHFCNTHKITLTRLKKHNKT